MALVRTDVSEELTATILRVTRIDECCSSFTDSCHPEDGGAMIFRNVGSYKSRTA
jgi:hypothetical protein